MTVHRIARTQIIHRPVDEVFSFFADARNLERITPPWLRFQVVTPEPITMRVGTMIEYRLRVHGVPMRWVSRIDMWEPGRAFVDRQIRGPYRLWEHLHTVEPIPEGTLSRDRVRYALPFGALGALAHIAVVRSDLGRVFDNRHDAVARIFA
jgi:ligand-binding SRPBCC domain-containing protein